MASLSFLSGYYSVWLTCYEFASIPPLPALHPKTACQRVPVSNGPHLRACPFRMTSAQRACIAFTRSKGSPPLLVLPESVSTAAPRRLFLALPSCAMPASALCPYVLPGVTEHEHQRTAGRALLWSPLRKDWWEIDVFFLILSPLEKQGKSQSRCASAFSKETPCPAFSSFPLAPPVRTRLSVPGRILRSSSPLVPPL